MKVRKAICQLVMGVLATLLWVAETHAQAPVQASTHTPVINAVAFGKSDEIVLTFAGKVADGPFLKADYYRVYEAHDPDIRLPVHSVRFNVEKKQATLVFAEALNQVEVHIVTVGSVVDDGLSSVETPLQFEVRKSRIGYLLSILITALLIKNFVFTKYLGLCVFMGTSKKKETAKGMGLTFSLVMVLSASMSWFFYTYFMVPYQLTYLQVVIFIGLVALSVQAVDTILRKVNPVLFSSFGIYLVLITTNCVIIAVPLMLAKDGYSFAESVMLAIGAGLGFMLALYLMASVRERLELALLPESFKGLPIAFIVAGQFALAFLGFSGMTIF